MIARNLKASLWKILGFESQVYKGLLKTMNMVVQCITGLAYVNLSNYSYHCSLIAKNTD